MLVFIDESGDPGMELAKGASDVFVTVAVIFEDDAQADACSHRIDSLRKELGLPAHVEFKFTKSSNKFRTSFLSAISSFNFFFMAVVIQKERLAKEDLRKKESFYQ